MAIEIKIQTPTPKQTGYTYKDLHLDLTLQKADITEEERFLYPPAASNDIKADMDLAAVRNSIRNIFLTKKGQRFLFPEFGSDLAPFLFEPITDYRSELLGDFIIESIEKWEPRVKINKVYVDPDPDNNEYRASIEFSVPSLGAKETNIQLQFNQTSQTIL